MQRQPPKGAPAERSDRALGGSRPRLACRTQARSPERSTSMKFRRCEDSGEHRIEVTIGRDGDGVAARADMRPTGGAEEYWDMDGGPAERNPDPCPKGGQEPGFAALRASRRGRLGRGVGRGLRHRPGRTREGRPALISGRCRRERRLPPSAGRFEVQRHAVDAVAQAGRRRPVGEDVAEMAAAGGAMHLGAHHAVAAVASWSRPTPAPAR